MSRAGLGLVAAALVMTAAPVRAQGTGPSPAAPAQPAGASGAATEGEELRQDGPAAAPARTARAALPDLSADVLQPGEGQLNLFYLQYSRGLLPGLQVSAHLLPYLITLLNLSGEYQFFHAPQLRASVEVGAYWFALSQAAQITVLQLHALPRATVPLMDGLDFTLSAELRSMVLALPGMNQDTRDLRGELSLVRTDGAGAWVLQARFPLIVQQNTHVEELLGQADVAGSLLLDDLGSWSVVLSRDFLFGATGHARVGLGYRNRPGLIFVDSIGNVIFQLDFYWR